MSSIHFYPIRTCNKTGSECRCDILSNHTHDCWSAVHSTSPASRHCKHRVVWKQYWIPEGVYSTPCASESCGKPISKEGQLRESTVNADVRTYTCRYYCHICATNYKNSDMLNNTLCYSQHTPS